ncbi:L-lysine 2,3-aminomutase [Lecanosticta acicola]|uniref:L-lysine 2,3-aminomutase n=1 Tax=Lecanosticta acicola TaxID=111012 RepID=A0AAI8W238_9PEZI|nr:L-lysine 2,3-aminomutase [Lecanosticta acicola]
MPLNWGLRALTRSSKNRLSRAGIVDRHRDLKYISQDLNCRGFVSTSSVPREDRQPYWQNIGIYQHATEEDFLSYQWQKSKTLDRHWKLVSFLESVLPDRIPEPSVKKARWAGIKTRDDFLADVDAGMKMAPMAVSLTPHILSVADWNNPLEDPIRNQFIPLKSGLKPDHPALTLDSLHEKDDSPVPGLVHRYPDKVLFLASSICPVYCRFCTRSYAVGSPTETNPKTGAPKPLISKWNTMLDYIRAHPEVQDVVVSGGDSYFLDPEHIRYIGDELLSVPHIQRFRFATKGLAVCPMRIIDPNDRWTNEVIRLSNVGREMGKHVALHTHFNHPAEITWATTLAARHLFRNGVTVRNQTVLLRGINDSLPTMSTLIRRLADLNIQPYYVYQADLIKGVEDLRTPLSTILDLEKQIRGTIAGFMMPDFVVDLPGGGGKRLAQSFESYDPVSGKSEWKAPGVTGDETFVYWDPKE